MKVIPSEFLPLILLSSAMNMGTLLQRARDIKKFYLTIVLLFQDSFLLDLIRLFKVVHEYSNMSLFKKEMVH